ncbi:MAG: ATP-dependent helicase [Verrucomicrobiota bacterium]|nr:MAG: ATP-dependent helicase [Verrucomicrobiota bacterium]
MKLADDAARQQFIHDHHTNFSVIAPAGVGKTTAIVARIVAIIQQRFIPFDQLYVVTYTKKAAQELYNRTLSRLFTQGDNPETSIQKIFFGTIHALADRILRQYGSLIDLPSDFQIETQMDSLWQDFLYQDKQEISILPPYTAFIELEDIERLVQMHSEDQSSALTPTDPIPFPTINWNLLLDFPAKNNRTIAEFQNNLRRWIQEPTLPFPSMSSMAKDFVELYRSVMEPVEASCARYFQQQYEAVREQFSRFRLQNGRLTYSDLIVFAQQALAMQSRRSGAYVLLDEAQDTDPEQFQLLLQIASDSPLSKPKSGHFCMVGDPQQSIYESRANVRFYQNLCHRLTQENALKTLEFSVTMRFSEAIAIHVNRVFQPLFEHSGQQVDFVPITAIKKDANALWQCLRTTQSDEEALVTLFQNKTPKDFGVTHWSEIAILAPRRTWLQELQQAFARPGLPEMQIHSKTTTYREFREFAWIEALVEFLWDPQNTFELAGILREIFGCSDDAIASYLTTPSPDPTSPVHSCYIQLHHLAKELNENMPLAIIDTLLEKLELRSRILAVQPCYHGDIERTVIRLAAQCPTLFEFKCQLHQLVSMSHEPESINENALQLYTFHKAKGLEWPVVFIPFINREPYPAPSIFPNLIHGQVVLNKAQQERMFPNLSVETRNNAQRLLYVALTRQQQRTIFIDDGTTPKSNSLKNILEGGVPFFDRLPALNYHS